MTKALRFPSSEEKYCAAVVFIMRCFLREEDALTEKYSYMISI
ncbi:hypothetical protein VRK_39010 [Vibrio sp. MEBiC08052]|nr:hypothetical protein VRK_39010 [Vibrio sp. MEBiC08052]